MLMRLYELNWGIYPRRVLVYLAEKGIDNIDRVSVDLMNGENRQPSFLGLNPSGTVPVLEVRGSVRQRGGNSGVNGGGHWSGGRGGDLAWHGVDRWRCKFGHRLGLHVAVLGLPFVVGLQQHRADQSDDRSFIGEDADNIGTAFDLLVQAFTRVGRVDLGPVLARKVHVRQHIGLALVDEAAKPGPLVAQLVGDVT